MHRRFEHTSLPILRLLVPAALLALSACASSEPIAPETAPPEAEPPGCVGQCEQSAIPACSADASAPLFDTLPVASNAIDEVIVFGELDPGGEDVVPNGQGGIRLAGQGVQLVAPGELFITGVSRTTFVESETREGLTDFGVSFSPCAEVRGSLLHVTALAPGIEALLEGASCETYSTTTETLEQCDTFNLEVPIKAGTVLGEVGGETAHGVDFDLEDERVVHDVSPRIGERYPHAVCFANYFAGAQRQLLEARTGLNGVPRTAQPACGTIEVDLKGTAQGVWVKKNNPVDYSVDASAFLTLAPDFLNPATTLALSAGDPLGSPLLTYPIGADRINTPFADVQPDGVIHCYQSSVAGAPEFLLALAADETLAIEAVAQDGEGSVCATDPASWAMSDGARHYIR